MCGKGRVDRVGSESIESVFKQPMFNGTKPLPPRCAANCARPGRNTKTTWGCTWIDEVQVDHPRHRIAGRPREIGTPCHLMLAPVADPSKLIFCVSTHYLPLVYTRPPSRSFLPQGSSTLLTKTHSRLDGEGFLIAAAWEKCSTKLNQQELCTTPCTPCTNSGCETVDSVDPRKKRNVQPTVAL